MRAPDGRRRLGASGEAAAAAWYVEHGYRILDRNWRAGAAGELDLVIGRDSLVIFCEVKTRSSVRYGSPMEAVTRPKQVRLRRLAASWLRAHPIAGRRDVRFDVASVMGGVVNVIENAF